MRMLMDNEILVSQHSTSEIVLKGMKIELSAAEPGFPQHPRKLNTSWRLRRAFPMTKEGYFRLGCPRPGAYPYADS